MYPHSTCIVIALWVVARNKKVLAAVVLVAAVAMWGISLTPLSSVVESQLNAVYTYIFKVTPCSTQYRYQRKNLCSKMVLFWVATMSGLLNFFELCRTFLS